LFVSGKKNLLRSASSKQYALHVLRGSDLSLYRAQFEEMHAGPGAHQSQRRLLKFRYRAKAIRTIREMASR
jgi:hypothetical protein